MVKRTLYGSLSLLALAMLVGACSEILGIVDAEPDPNADGPLCASYCSAALANCTDTNTIYASLETCLGVCNALEEGTPGAEIGNTVHCRLTNALLAGTTGEPEGQCPAAGPGGDTACGPSCLSYCALFENICPVRFEDIFQGQTDCNTKCEQVPSVGPFSVLITEGNSIECRLYHLSAATVDDDQHCPHAAGEAPCVGSGAGGGSPTGGSGGNNTTGGSGGGTGGGNNASP